MNSFMNSFNESKSITRVDGGMWVDGDRGVGVILTNSNVIQITRKWEYKAPSHSSALR